MVRAANAWSKRDLAIAAAAVALQAHATRNGFGGPCALLLLIIAPFVFGRDAWDGEHLRLQRIQRRPKNRGHVHRRTVRRPTARRSAAATATPVRDDNDAGARRRPRRPARPKRPSAAQQTAPAPVVDAATRRRRAAASGRAPRASGRRRRARAP